MKEVLNIIKIYYRGCCNSSKSALKWFENKGFEFQKIRIREISLCDLITVLSITDGGIDGLTKNPCDKKITSKYIRQLQLIDNMSFNEALIYLKNHPECLRTPIIIENNKCHIGFNQERVREFIPTNFRKLKYKY